MTRLGLIFTWMGILLFSAGCGLFVGQDRIDCSTDTDCASGHECKAGNCVPDDAVDTNGENPVEDAGAAVDSGAASDSGGMPDAGSQADAAVLPEAGPMADGGMPADAGSLDDSGSAMDAGAPPPDAGTIPDSGPALDAGAVVDSGINLDPDGGATFRVAVTVTGYRSVDPLYMVLKSNSFQIGSREINSEGYKTVGPPLPNGTPWELVLEFQPEYPGQTCSFDSVDGGTATGVIDGADVNLNMTCITHTFTMRVDVQGFDDHEGFRISTWNGGTYDIPVGTTGMVTIGYPEDGTFYDVDVVLPPGHPNRFCWTLNGRGLVRKTDVQDITILCGVEIFASTTGVDVADTTVDTTCDTPAQGCTLRAAIQTATRWTWPVRIRLASGGNYPIEISTAEGTGDQLPETGDFDLATVNAGFPPQIQITGDEVNPPTINGNNISRIFDLKNGSLRVDDVILINGAENVVSGRGGTVFARAPTQFEMRGSHVQSGDAQDDVGGVYIGDNATGLVVRSLFWNNTAAGNGGAMRAVGATRIFESSFIGNGSSAGGALSVGGDVDDHSDTTALVVNSTFGDNARNGGTGAAIHVLSGEVLLIHNTITQNEGQTLALSGGETIMRANVLAENAGSDECYFHPQRAMGQTFLTSWTRNFIGAGGTCDPDFATGFDDLPTGGGELDPMLTTLQQGGTSNAAYEPEPGNPLEEESLGALCPFIDQRQNPRDEVDRREDWCDVGAIEVFSP
jgi:hypothetical protein